MQSLMQGLNYILEYGIHPWDSSLGEEIEDFEKDIENEEDLVKKEELTAILNEEIEKSKKINIPILEQFNKFFDLYPQGTYMEIPIQVLFEMRRSLEKYGVEGTAFGKLFANGISPAMTDSAALLTIENTLKERKKLLLQEVLKGRDINKEVKDLAENAFKNETFIDPTATQEYALKLLNDYYNPRTEK